MKWCQLRVAQSGNNHKLAIVFHTPHHWVAIRSHMSHFLRCGVNEHNLGFPLNTEMYLRHSNWNEIELYVKFTFNQVLWETLLEITVNNSPKAKLAQTNVERVFSSFVLCHYLTMFHLPTQMGCINQLSLFAYSKRPAPTLPDVASNALDGIDYGSVLRSHQVSGSLNRFLISGKIGKMSNI